MKPFILFIAVVVLFVGALGVAFYSSIAMIR